MLETVIQSLFAQAQAQNGRASTCLSKGLWLVADTRSARRTLVLFRRVGQPSMQEARICAKYAGFKAYAIAPHGNKLVVFEKE
ncbi:hypothetical protein [Meiothermus cerbereus]|jgi:hypothetical protein|uniref:hypothetical protein n=1 Tax=Meiothermus cerbereus TaxID=65552 RepID=UPI000489DF56|nr:hypothetical protein [Meiothermus cerbereus]